MKKLSLILLVSLASLALLTGFTGCGGDEEPAKAQPAKPAAKAEKAKPAAKAEEANPAAKAEEAKPAAKADEAKPAAKAEEAKPAAKADEAAQAKPEYPAGLETEAQRISYVLGLNLGKRLGRDQIEVEADAFSMGIKDGMSNAKPKLSEEQAKTALTIFSQQMAAKAQAKKEAEGKLTKEAGDKYREEFAKKEGVKTTPSGLLYRVLKAGDGPSPTLEDTVTTHYKGSTIDGKEFDSSYSRNKPASFPVKGVIKGWQEILQLMKVGDKLEVVIPPELGYGDQGAGQIIKPYSTLVFEIELLSIGEPKAEEKAGEAKDQASGWKKMSDNDKAAQALKKALEQAEAKKKAEAAAAAAAGTKDAKTE